MAKKKQLNPYRKTLNVRDKLIVIFQGIALCGFIAWIFYDSVFAVALLPLTMLFCYRNRREKLKKIWAEKFDLEFREILVAIANALESGYSIENAFRDAQDNLHLLYGDGGILNKDLQELNTKIKMRVSAEQALNEFAEKYPTEEVLGFAGVFSFARRLGGGYMQNIRRTAEKMEEKLELKQDIRTAVAEKQMEFRVMCIMPIGILSYVKLTSKDFLNPIYGNMQGVVVMSICIGIYLLSFYLGKRIVDIRV